MHGKPKRIKFDSLIQSIRQSSLHFEMKKSHRGAVAVIGNVMSIGEYSDSEITVVSHIGRVVLSGESLTVTVLEEHTVEIYGRIEEVRFSYGKA